MNDEQGVTPVVEASQPEVTVSDAQVSEVKTPSVFDSMIGGEEATPDSSPESETAKAETSDSTKPEGETSSVSDEKANKVPDAIPYTRFTEVNNKYKEAAAKAQQYEEFLNNPELVAKYLQETHKAQVQFSEAESVKHPSSLAEINAQIKALDVLDDNYAENLAQLLDQKDALYMNAIDQTLTQRQQATELQSQQELILGDVFKDRPDAQAKAEAYLISWVEQNPGAKFPFPGKQGWQVIDSIVNGTTNNTIEQGRQEAIQSLNTKKVLDGGTQSQQPTGTASGFDPFASMY